MHQLYALYENASGYALFRTTEFEEIAIFMPEVQKSVLDISKFRSIVFLVAFQPFKSIHESLENMKSISEGQLHMDLQLFLENNVPKSKKSKQSVVLGVQEPTLASAITETLGISCTTSGVVSEVLRGIRFHFHKLVKGYKDQNTIIKSQLGLSHHYARAKMNINIHNFDKMITQTISMMDQLEKDINASTLSVKQWYSFHFPELTKLVPDGELYIKCIREIKNRKDISENTAEALQAILNDPDKVQEIMKAAANSMGRDIADVDYENIENYADRTLSFIKRRDELNEYLETKMHLIAPNLSALIGEKVGARLISQAGSLTSLAKFPASTIQILGAEKSLFRSLKTKGSTAPNFNSVNQSALIGKSSKSVKGRISRYLANKCSLAARIDCFSVKPTDAHGKNLKETVEQQRRFFETGKFGNNVVPEMSEERKAAVAAKKALLRRKKRERRRQKLAALKEENCSKTAAPASNVEVSENIPSEEGTPKPVKQKSMKRKSKVLTEEDTEIGETQSVKENGIKKQPKLKKKKKSIAKNLEL